MKPRLSPSYLENLLAGASYDSLTDLWALLEGCDAYNRQRADYGLTTPLFLFAESLLWFAQSTRSGMVTYFEVTPAERQQLMAEALLAFAPPGFAAAYAAGRADWMVLKLVAERNRLIHKDLLSVNFDSADDCARMSKQLDEQNERVCAQLAQLKSLREASKEAFLELQRYFESEEFLAELRRQQNDA